MSDISPDDRRASDELRRAVAGPVDKAIEAYKRDVDRTLLRENLRLTPDERFLRLMELQRFAEELRRGVEEQKRK
jgi:hypothetical protein